MNVIQFRAFVKAKNYVTEAEKFGDGGVFDFVYGKWDMVKGANWKSPFDPDKPTAEDNHPVTQVS